VNSNAHTQPRSTLPPVSPVNLVSPQDLPVSVPPTVPEGEYLPLQISVNCVSADDHCIAVHDIIFDSDPISLGSHESVHTNSLPAETQLEIQGHDLVENSPMPEFSPPVPMATGKDTTTTEKETFSSLEKFARQWFIATFNNQNVDGPIRSAMPGILTGHAIYRDARKRIQDLYKNWKNRTLRNAEEWFTTWMEQPRNRQFAMETKFSTLRNAVMAGYAEESLFYVFPWAVPSISFAECSPSGKAFLKCMSIGQLRLNPT
jgi:hypothetical protein